MVDNFFDAQGYRGSPVPPHFETSVDKSCISVAHLAHTLFVSFAYILSITPLTHYTSLNSVNWQGSASALFWFSEYTAWPIMNRERMAVMGAVVGAIVVTSVVLATATRQLPFYTRLAWCILPSPGSGLTCSTTASGLLSATATSNFSIIISRFLYQMVLELNWACIASFEYSSALMVFQLISVDKNQLNGKWSILPLLYSPAVW